MPTPEPDDATIKAWDAICDFMDAPGWPPTAAEIEDLEMQFRALGAPPPPDWVEGAIQHVTSQPPRRARISKRRDDARRGRMIIAFQRTPRAWVLGVWGPVIKAVIPLRPPPDPDESRVASVLHGTACNR